MNNRFLLVMLACVAVFIGLLIFNKNEAGAPSDPNVQPTSHVRGEGTTGVTLTEYGDFECIACYQYYPLVKQVKEEYGNRISFQFRHFPIVDAHPNAMAAHRAAEAAAIQGKFWEMHDLLFENYQSWQAQATNNPTPIFESYAQQLGLDIEQYQQDVASSSVNDAIQADMRAGREAGVTGTPTFYINGQEIVNKPGSLEEFKELIDEAIANQEQ